MAEEPRSYNPDWPVPQTDTPTMPGSPTAPGAGPSSSSLPPRLKGDDGLRVDYDGYAYVIRMDLSEAQIASEEASGLWTPVWRQSDGRFYRVDFSSLRARIDQLGTEFDVQIQNGLDSIGNTLTTRQNNFEASLGGRMDTAEASYATYQSNMDLAWTSYQGTVNASLDQTEARLVQVEADVAKALEDVAAGSVLDRAVSFIKLAVDVEDMVRDKSWASITGKPLTFQPSAHRHLWADLDSVPASFPPSAHTHLWADLTDKPATFPPSAHTHAWGDVTDKPLTFAPSAHRHPWAELDDVPATFPAAPHVHPQADIDGLTADLAAKWNTADLPAGAAGKSVLAEETVPGIQSLLGIGKKILSHGDYYDINSVVKTGTTDTLLGPVITIVPTTATSHLMLWCWVYAFMTPTASVTNFRARLYNGAWDGTSYARFGDIHVFGSTNNPTSLTTAYNEWFNLSFHPFTLKLDRKNPVGNWQIGMLGRVDYASLSLTVSVFRYYWIEIEP